MPDAMLSRSYYAYDITVIGDLDDDGIEDYAVGALTDDNDGADKGSVFIHFMYADGTVKATKKIASSDIAGIDDYDSF